MLAGGRIGETSLAWQLVALLPVLAPTLSVALPGDHDGTSAFATDVPRRKGDREHRFAVLDAFGLMLQTTCVQEHGAARLADQVCGFFNRLGRYAAHFRGALGSPRLYRFRGLLEAGGMRIDECLDP